MSEVAVRAYKEPPVRCIKWHPTRGTRCDLCALETLLASTPPEKPLQHMSKSMTWEKP